MIPCCQEFRIERWAFYGAIQEGLENVQRKDRSVAGSLYGDLDHTTRHKTEEKVGGEHGEKD